MDLFHLLVDVDKLKAKRVAPPISPERPKRLLHRERRSRRSDANGNGDGNGNGNGSGNVNGKANLDIPELVDNESLTSEGTKSSSDSETLEDRIRKVKERREEMERVREIALTNKNRQAILRAQQNIECKRERLRKERSRVAKVCARRTMMEEKQRRHVLASIENKLNGAISRAEQMSKKKQHKARHDHENRAERARKKRELAEFERRSALLSSVDRRSNLAERNVQRRLLSRQFRAREEIEKAQEVARRVRSVRTLQRAIRRMLGSESESEVSVHVVAKLSQNDAAARLQLCRAWRVKMVCHRLSSSSEKSQGKSTPLASLQILLSQMGLGSSKSTTPKTFEDLTRTMTESAVLTAAQELLYSFNPLLSSSGSAVSDRTILSAFLVSEQPFNVLGPKRGNDKCSRLLETASKDLTNILVKLSEAKKLHDISSLVPTVTSALLSYCTFFEKWKNADIEELVAQMKKSAEQSWISYLISKEALNYAEEQAKLVEKQQGDPFFQINIRYKSSRKGSSSHIKRIRASLDKLIGVEEGLRVMKKARSAAISRVKKEGLVKNAKSEIDDIAEAHAVKTTSSAQDQSDLSDSGDEKFDINDSNALENVNEHVVHEILLTDKEGLKERLCGKQSQSIADSVQGFMDKFRNQNQTPSSVVTAEDFAFTMERAFFDKILDEWTSDASLKGVEEMLVEMFTKMRSLVPKRKDLHDYFTDDHAKQCKNSTDVLALLVRIGEVMGDSLESPYRAQSTLDWLRSVKTLTNSKSSKIPFDFPDTKSFVVGSIAFLVKKLDLCHADLVNYRLIKVTPLILQNGVQYERQRFQQKYGTTNEKLLATKQWLDRMDLTDGSNSKVMREGFVDELLFVKERISMPEVLALDSARIGSIRERTQRTVLTAALFLHAFNITTTSFSTLKQSGEVASKMDYYKDQVQRTLKANLPYENLCSETISILVSFVKAVCDKEMKENEIRMLVSSTESVLKGSDPVLSLLDKRVRDIFKSACTFVQPNIETLGKAAAPLSMRTGIQNTGAKASDFDSQKIQFVDALSQKSTKLGFNVAVNDLVETTYDAFKVIEHCMKVHEHDVLIPIANEAHRSDAIS